MKVYEESVAGYRIWFRFHEEAPGTEHFAECRSIEAARKAWDALSASGAYLLCLRP